MAYGVIFFFENLGITTEFGYKYVTPFLCDFIYSSYINVLNLDRMIFCKKNLQHIWYKFEIGKNFPTQKSISRRNLKGLLTLKPKERSFQKK